MRYLLMKVHRYDHMVYVDISEVIEFRDPAIERRQQEIALQHNVDFVKHVVVFASEKIVKRR
ncbi:transcriptional repressor [Zhongshania aquimaris]|uniref:Transcriptional repressor n=1 Tax=Zhongshania aquimaris TaxID=2857107 RepID=A0ABS6VP09_9GAMM|nr:transcriptional repressor [Zhongshania aquimaris]MBW2940054.1 transcriptional repressor [Zhongshania aquimaris]